MIYFFKSEIDGGSYEQLKAQLWTAPELLRQQVWNRKLFKKSLPQQVRDRKMLEQSLTMKIFKEPY